MICSRISACGPSTARRTAWAAFSRLAVPLLSMGASSRWARSGRPVRPAELGEQQPPLVTGLTQAGAGLQLARDLSGQGQSLLTVAVPAQQVSRGPDPCFQPDRRPRIQGRADSLLDQRIPVAGCGPGPGQAQVGHQQVLPPGVSGRGLGQRFPGDLPGGFVVA
jgi:hypothetical protein